MNENKKSQQIQDEEYQFPYHYIPEFKNSFTQTYNWVWGIKYISAIEFVLNKIKKLDFLSIADIGTGDGRLVKEMSLYFPDKEIMGIDYSERAIMLAKAMNPKLNFKVIDIINENTNLKFDIITLIEVFEHIPLDSTSDFVNKLHSMLNKNGQLILTVPHKNKPLLKKHFQHFSSTSLKENFTKLFNIEEEIFFESRSKFVRIINLLLVNRIFIINNNKINNLLYKIYKKYFFTTNEKDCGRIFLLLRKK